MSLTRFVLTVIFIIRLFTSVFRVPRLETLSCGEINRNSEAKIVGGTENFCSPKKVVFSNIFMHLLFNT